MTGTSPVSLTVGLPVRNGEAYVDGALRSLLSHPRDDLRLIISDNASTDGTEEICRHHATVDSRVHYHRQPFDIGANRNFNWLAEQNRSPYFRWAAADDVVTPSLMTDCLDALDDDPHASLAFTRTVLIDDVGREMAEQVDDADRAGAPDPVDRFGDIVENETWCMPVFGVIRSKALARTRLLLPFYGADRVLLAELALAGHFRRVDGPEFLRRCHDEQSTVMSVDEKARWTTGMARRVSVPAPVKATVAFATAAFRADLSSRDRHRALSIVARHVTHRLDRVVRPGPYNYLGWRGRDRAHPYAHLDLTATGPEREG